jgi:uncharacterized membrane protein
MGLLMLTCFQNSCCLEADMIGKIRSEIISCRRALPIALGFAAPPAALTSSGAEAQTAGRERRQERRTGRRQRLQARRKSRQKRPIEHSAQRRRKVALAFQGGGSHGAYTWGVLDRLLDDAPIDIIGRALGP